MPSVSRAQHRLMEGVAHSPAFARKVGIPQAVGNDFVNADKRAGRYAGSENHMDKMSGINQHKREAMGEKIDSGEGGKGDFGVDSLHESAMEHPDHGMHTGEVSADHERGAPHPVKHNAEMHHAQAAPDHGPHHMHKGRR